MPRRARPGRRRDCTGQVQIHAWTAGFPESDDGAIEESGPDQADGQQRVHESDGAVQHGLGINDLNKSFASFASSLHSNQALQAAGLVGHTVLAPTGAGQLVAGGSIGGAVDLPPVPRRCR